MRNIFCLSVSFRVLDESRFGPSSESCWSSIPFLFFRLHCLFLLFSPAFFFTRNVFLLQLYQCSSSWEGGIAAGKDLLEGNAACTLLHSNMPSDYLFDKIWIHTLTLTCDRWSIRLSARSIRQRSSVRPPPRSQAIIMLSEAWPAGDYKLRPKRRH